MDYFGRRDDLDKTPAYDGYNDTLVMPSFMDRFYNSPNSFRGTRFQTSTECRKDPWAHGNLGGYLRKLGAATYWPMPDIIEPAVASVLTNLWRDRAISSFKEFAPPVLHFTELLAETVDRLIAVELADSNNDNNDNNDNNNNNNNNNNGENNGGSRDRGDNTLQETLSEVVGDAWSRVLEREEFKDLFGPDTELPGHCGAGLDAWWTAFQRTEWHESNAKGHNLPTRVPVAVYDFTPDRHRQSADGDPTPTGKEPDFTAYNEYCQDHKLPLMIPGLNTTDLMNRDTLMMFLGTRAAFPPPTFAAQDFNAMQIGRSGRLLLPPYCDACFLNFAPKDINEVFAPRDYVDKEIHKEGTKGYHPNAKRREWSAEHVTGEDFYGIFVQHPSANETEGLRDARRSGLVFGWGDGLLVLQAQATILRFCAELTKSLLSIALRDVDETNKHTLELRRRIFMPLHYSYPLRMHIPEAVVSKVVLREALERFSRGPYPLPKHPDAAKEAIREGMWQTLVTKVVRPYPWLCFQSRMMTYAYGEIDRPGHIPDLDSLSMARCDTAAVNYSLFDPKNGGKDTIQHTFLLLKMQEDPNSFFGFFKAYLDLHYGKIPVSRPDGGQGPGVLAHFASTDIEAKRALANDIIRRVLRQLIFSSEIQACFFYMGMKIDAVDECTPRKSQCVTGSLLWLRGKAKDEEDEDVQADRGQRSMTVATSLVLFRRLAEVSWTMIRGQGLFHGAPGFAELCQRSPPQQPRDPNDPWRLPSGLMKGDRPGLAVPVHRPEDHSGDWNRKDWTWDVLRLLELGPPNIAYGIPTAGLMAQQISGCFCEMSTFGWFGLFEGSVLVLSVQELAALCARISALQRIDPLSDERGAFHDNMHSPFPDYDLDLKNDKSYRFLDAFDDFNFESHVSQQALDDIHRHVLGIKYANEPVSAMTGRQLQQITQEFFRQVFEWLRQSESPPSFFAKQMRTMTEYCANLPISPGKTFLDRFGDELLQQPVDVLGPIETIDPNLMDLDQQQQQQQPGPAVPQENIVLGPEQPLDGGQLLNFFAPRPADEPVGGVQQPPQGPRLPSPNRNHDQGGNGRLRNRGNRPGGGVGGGGNSGAGIEPRRKGLASKHWKTARSFFGSVDDPTAKSGSVRNKDFCSLMQALGFQAVNAAGSRMDFHRTEATLIPKPEHVKANVVKCHMPHEKGPIITGHDLQRWRKAFAKFGITAETIERYHVGVDDDGDGDGGQGRAMRAHVVGLSDVEGDEEGDEEENDDDEIRKESQEGCVGEDGIRVNGINGDGLGKRKKREHDEDEYAGGALPSYKKARPTVV